jgi:hypothetical protein
VAAKKILFLMGDFAEDYEVMVPFQALTMLGMLSMPCAQTKRRVNRSRPPSMISKEIKPIPRSRGTISC